MSGTLQITDISPGTYNVTSKITDGCLPTHQVATSPPVTLAVCPSLSADIIIVPTTLRNGEQFRFTSIADGGEPTGDGFRHEILIDENVVFDSGVEKSRTVTGYITVSGLSIGDHSITSRITDGCLPTHQVAYHPSITLTVTDAVCPSLSASLTITPTTISSGGSITYTSEAIGGEPLGDGFGHKILIDGNVVYDTGLRKARIMSGTLQITDISPGTYNVTSKITDGCLPTHQVATSPPVTLTVTGIPCQTPTCNFTITQ